jgi:hypothetical protein
VTLMLEYSISASEELYVADRLWDYDEQRQRVPDPFGVYRFVRDGSLRLVFAPAPRPANVLPRVTYTPLWSKVAAGEIHRRKIPIALPVDEYSILARDVASESVVEEVSRVVLVVRHRARDGMDADPQPPPGESASEAGYIVYDGDDWVSSMDIEPLPVKRRLGYIARFPLPGEPAPEPFYPPAS